MNIIRKIKDLIERKKVVNEIFDDMKNLDEVLLAKRLEIFEKIVTPKFAEIGLNNWNGKYLWYSDFNEHGVKHVVEYNVFKYYGGSFSFGNCYNFIPTISGKKLINHKTEKSTKILDFNRLPGWQSKIENNYAVNLDKVSTINEAKFLNSLEDVLTRNCPKIHEWFLQNVTIEQNISGILRKIENPVAELGERIISNEYLLSFLYIEINEFNKSNDWLKVHFDKGVNTESEKLLIKARIKTNANRVGGSVSVS